MIQLQIIETSCISIGGMVVTNHYELLQHLLCAGCARQPCHMLGDHQERVHEDDHQHLPLQPGHIGPGHLVPHHARRALSYVAPVSVDIWGGHFKHHLIKDYTFVLS